MRIDRRAFKKPFPFLLFAAEIATLLLYTPN